MKTRIAIFLLVVLSIAGYAQKLDGSWKGKMSSPQGDMDLLFTFKTDANNLSGNVSSPGGDLPLENGKINGNEFSFDINVGGQVMSHTGVLDGDKIKLSLVGFEQSIELNRAKEESKIDGKWLGKASSPQGDFEITFTFKVDGNKLTGKNSSAMGDIDLTNGVVNGSDFSFDIDMQDMKINHKCKYMADDSIEVKANVMDQEMVMKLTRVTQ